LGRGVWGVALVVGYEALLAGLRQRFGLAA
jgi:hypothetical protein